MSKGFTVEDRPACQPTCPPKVWRRRKPCRRQARSAFTLVEMLVVIAILGILMAMMVPAAGMILKRAKIASARGDAGIVTTVMMKYRSEYNRWPGFYYTGTPPHLTQDLWVTVMSPEPIGPPHEDNMKRIMFFTPGGGALDEVTGSFTDPWGQAFAYRVDENQDGMVEHPDVINVGGEIRAQVIAWSAGPDGDINSWDDNVTSWE